MTKQELARIENLEKVIENQFNTIQELTALIQELKTNLSTKPRINTTTKPKTTQLKENTVDKYYNNNTVCISGGIDTPVQVEFVESAKKQQQKPYLVYDGKYVKTNDTYISKKVRYAIKQSITKDFGGVQLYAKNPVYDKCKKTDKFVQVYEFATVEDCEKFRKAQAKYNG